MKSKLESGKRGEDLAVNYLINNKYKILERNFRCTLGEIDVIARDGSTIAFIEVKSKSSGRFGRPEEAVDHKKQIKISRTALFYLKSRFTLETRARFDVVSIYMNTHEPPAIRLIKNAFDLVL